MSNEKRFLVVGQRYRFVISVEGGEKTVPGKYLGFQVEGGTTILGFEYTTRENKQEVYLCNSDHLFGLEVVPETVEKIANPTGPEKLSTPVVIPPPKEVIPITPPPVRVSTTTAEIITPDPVVDSSAMKRKPGRPRKNAVPGEDTATAGSVEKRKPGRPRKNVDEIASEVSSKPTVGGVLFPPPEKKNTSSDDNVEMAPIPEGALGKKKPGRPPKDDSNVVPPSIPTPHSVEEVTEIEERSAVPEKEVTSAVAPNDDDIDVRPESLRDKDDEETSGIVALDNEDVALDNEDEEKEVVVAPTVKAPKRPVSSLARASRIPDEVDGDL